MSTPPPSDDRDLHLSDLITGRWTAAARLAHRDTGARRTDCPTCFAAGRVRATRALSTATRDTALRVSDLLTLRWTLHARRMHRAEEAAFLTCLDCSGTGRVPADLLGDPILPPWRAAPDRPRR